MCKCTPEKRTPFCPECAPKTLLGRIEQLTECETPPLQPVQHFVEMPTAKSRAIDLLEEEIRTLNLRVNDLLACNTRYLEEKRKVKARKDEAYHERNKVVALLTSIFPSGITHTDIPGWDPEWHGCVYIDLPTGQVSWHYHDSQAYLFEHLPPYQGGWDGHDTDEKYRRVLSYAGVKVSHG